MANDYINYQGMVTTVTTGISKLDSICAHLSMDAQTEEMAKINDRLKNHVFSVGIMGEFKRGKSTVINALLGQEIVPADVVPCSATLNYVRWDVNKRAEINFKDGQTTEVDVEELANYVTKITDESAETAESVDNAVVYYPCQFCQNGVQIVDTPGLNDDERMTEISERVIPTLDAIIMVITVDSPFSQSEAEFVRNKVMTSDMGRIIFLVNKIDMIDEEDRPRLIESIKTKIKKSVLKKMAIIHGEDSDEYKAAKDKIGGIRLIPVSAKKALRGKIRNKPEMVEESGYPEFEAALSHLLTEERGMLELIHPVNQLMSISKEGLQIIDTRLKAMQMDSEEFEKAQKESIQKINDTRAKKKEEIHNLRSKGKTLYADLVPEVSGLYDNVENALYEYVNNREISESDIANQAAIDEFTRAISAEINKEIENQLSGQLEKLHVQIENQLGRDVQKFEEVGREITAEFEEIRLAMQGAGSGGSNNSIITSTVIEGVANVALASATSYVIPGIGGIISGFREHGVKGAVVGGLAGAGLSYATIMLLGAAGIAGFPLALLGGLAASFGGKKITQLFFGKAKKESSNQISTEKVRDYLYDSVSRSVSELRQNMVIENWLKDTCENIYNAVADDIDREWENSLQTMEGTLSQIKIDLEMNAENRRKSEQDMAEWEKGIVDIVESVTPIHTKLNAALNQE